MLKPCAVCGKEQDVLEIEAEEDIVCAACLEGLGRL